MSQKLIARMIAMAGELGVPTWRAGGHPSGAFDVHRAAGDVTSGGASFVSVV
jgi:hypothetical protein